MASGLEQFPASAVATARAKVAQAEKFLCGPGRAYLLLEYNGSESPARVSVGDRWPFGRDDPFEKWIGGMWDGYVVGRVAMVVLLQREKPEITHAFTLPLPSAKKVSPSCPACGLFPRPRRHECPCL